VVICFPFGAPNFLAVFNVQPDQRLGFEHHHRSLPIDVRHDRARISRGLRSAFPYSVACGLVQRQRRSVLSTPVDQKKIPFHSRRARIAPARLPSTELPLQAFLPFHFAARSEEHTSELQS